MGKNKTIFYGYVYIYEYIFKHLKYICQMYIVVWREYKKAGLETCFFCNILCAYSLPLNSAYSIDKKLRSFEIM